MVASAGRAGAESSGFVRGIIAVCVAANLFVCLLVAAALWQNHLTLRSRGETTVVNMSRLLQQTLSDSIEKVDLALLAATDEIEHEQAFGEGPGRLDGFLRRERARYADIDTLHVADAGGTIVHGAPLSYGAPVNVADRPYFLRLRDDPAAGLVMSKLLIGRVTGNQGVVMARRLEAPDGAFAGVVLAVFNLDRFLEIFSALDVGPHGSVMLCDIDLQPTVLIPSPGETVPGTPFPALAEALASGAANGQFTARSPFDGIERIFAFRRLGGYPAFVVVGVAISDLWGDWRQGAAAWGGLTCAFLLFSVIGGIFLSRAWIWRGKALSDAEVAQARLTAVLQNTPVGLAIVGTDRIIRLANKTIADLYHIESEALVGQSAAILYGSQEQFLDLGRRAYGDILAGQTYQAERIMQRHDGSKFWCRMRGRLLDSRQTALGVAWVMEDVSERKRNEEQIGLLRSLIEYTSDCVYVVSPALGFRMVFANDATCAHYGLSRGEILTKRVPELSLDLADEDALEAWWHAVREQKSMMMQSRHCVWSGGGGVVPVEVSANYLLHDGEEFIAGYFRDISARIADEKSLLEKSDALARSNTDLEQFAYVASHDLREPLRMVNSFLGLLERRYAADLCDEAREFIDFARDGAQRMDRLILDLLDYSRIGRLSRRFEAVTLGEVVADVLLTLQGRIGETGATVKIDGGLPTVAGDRGELFRLFQNLIANALKYRSPSRPPMISVEASAQGSGWVIAISDNGIGIDAQHFERIFGLFQRLHGQQAYDGTGIGLAICKKIVEHHGGRIWLKSSPDVGSRFFVQLPAADPPAPSEPAGSQAA